jgi:hypothetical protein
MGFHKPGEIRAAFALGRGLAPKGREKYRSCCRAGKDRDIDTVRRSAEDLMGQGKLAMMISGPWSWSNLIQKGNFLSAIC